MVVKKKTVKITPAPLEEAVAEEEKRPAVTQVVEVVEEAPPVEETPAVVAPKPMETPSVPQEPVSSISEAPPSVEATDEKRKELVDELFQNKSPNVSPVMPEISIHTNRSSKPIVLWAIVLIVACIVAGASLLLMSGKKGLPSIVAVPTPTPTATPKITATPTSGPVKRSDITVQVWNGGGKAGAATKMKTFLEGKGYTVSDTGNADAYTYDKTEIVVKSTKKAYITLLEEDLKGAYKLGTSSAALVDTVSWDARVIVGKE